MLYILLLEFFMRSHSTVQRGAVDAEQFGGFADVSGGQFQCGVYIASFLLAQMLIKIEIACSEPVLSRARVVAKFRRYAGSVAGCVIATRNGPMWRLLAVSLSHPPSFFRLLSSVRSGRRFKRVEFVLQLVSINGSPGIFRGKPDDDVAQFAVVAGKAIAFPIIAAPPGSVQKVLGLIC